MFSPVRWGVIVNGKLMDLAAVTSATATIDGVTFDLTVNTTINRLTGTLPAGLSLYPGVYTGYATLVTNSGTYRFPDAPNNLTLIVLEGALPPASTFTIFTTEDGDFLTTEDGFYLTLET